MKIRTGHKTFIEPLIRCLVQSLAKYKVTPNDLLGIYVNGVVHHNWKTSDDDDVLEDGDDCEYRTLCVPKRRRRCDDRTYIMPSRKTVHNYLDNASYLNLEMVARHLAEISDNMITVGLNDTTKAAGHRLFSIKADHITVAGPTTGKKTFTTGYVENPSHSGEDVAKTYDFKPKSLAILADCSTEELNERIDFRITDPCW